MPAKDDTYMEIRAAEQYEACDDLWTITCVFNPSGYRSKLENYWRFSEHFRRSGLPLVTVECAFLDAPWAIPASPDVIQVRSNSFLWQKERLLNIALSQLPPEAKKVVWIDGDLLFSNRDWAVQTSRLLETVPFAQPFQHWCRMPENALSYQGIGETGHSFAYTSRTDPAAMYEARHGLPGFAWAARRDVLDKHGLYDACIIGGGDHVMGHALNGSIDTTCVRRILGTLPPRPRGVIGRVKHVFTKNGPFPEKFTTHYVKWAEAVYADVQNNLGSVPGHLLHLWHGDLGNRQYHTRHEQLQQFHFDPDTDLWKNADGAWEWSDARPDMQQWARDYFQKRREDG